MNREVIYETKGMRATDGAGVQLVRVFGNRTTDIYDPFLMFDAFDSKDKSEYEAGFPMHPHRGILGAQLWLNLPAKDKMSAPPAYHSITNKEIKEFKLEGGKLRLITGKYKNEEGWQGKYLPLDFYDIHLEANAKIEIPVREGWSAFVFTLLGDVTVGGKLISEKTAAKLGEGDRVLLETKESGAEILIYASKRLDEPVAWYGPIVMNTHEEIRQAFEELNAGTFIKERADYSN